MIKRLIFISVISLISLAYKSQTWQWYKEINASNSTDGGLVNYVDKNGNIYMSGSFTGTVNLGSGIVLSRVGSGGSTDGFIAKYDSMRNCLWAINISASFGCGCNGPYFKGNGGGVVGEFSDGDLLIAGSYCGCSGLFGNITTTDAGYVWFLGRFKPSSSQWTWVKTKPENFTNTGKILAIKMDKHENIYMSGDNQAYPVLFGNLNFSQPDCFLAKFDKNGNGIWYKNTCTGINGYIVNNLTIEHQRIFAVGVFGGNTSFGSQTFSVTGGISDGFVTLMDTSANHIRTTTFESNDADYILASTFVNSQLYFASSAFSSNSVAVNSTTLDVSGNNPNTYLARVDTNLNVLTLKGLGTYTLNGVNLLTHDYSGNVYGLVGCDITDTYDGVTINGKHYAMLKWNSAFVAQWAEIHPGNYITCDSMNNVYTSNSFSTTTQFGPYNISPANGVNSIVFGKIKDLATQTVERSLNNKLTIYPNPSANASYTVILPQSISSSKSLKISVINSLGQFIDTEYSVKENNIYLSLSNEPAGAYTITLSVEGQLYNGVLMR